MDDIKRFIVLGVIGALAAMLFYIEELVTDNTHDVEKIKELGYIRVGFLVFANGVFGSVIMIGAFYGLLSVLPTWHIYFIGAVSAILAFMAKDTIRIVHKIVMARSEKGSLK